MNPRILVAAALIALAGGCRGTPPANPELGAATWQVHANEQAGYRIAVPDVYAIETHHGGKDAIFRLDGYPVLAINLTDEIEAGRRGLWARHQPRAEGVLAGRRADRYDYDHCDGPMCMRTVSLVIPYRGRYLALEFRTDGDRFDPVQQRILESLTLTARPPS